MIFRYALAVLVLGFSLFTTPSAVFAEEFYWSHADWQLSVRQVESQEDDHSNCRAWTGGDGEPIVEFQHYTGDAGPPYGYPLLTVNEYAPRGYDTLIQDGDQVLMVFDDGTMFMAEGATLINDDGIKEAFASPQYDKAQSILQAMQRGNRLSISVGGQVLYLASMNGFSAVYGKMAEVCNFSTEGVLD